MSIRVSLKYSCKKIIKTGHIICGTLSLLLLIGVACQKSRLPEDEQTFRSIVSRLIKYIAKVKAIPPEKQKIGEFGFQLHFEKRAQYVKKNEEIFEKMDNELSEFIHKYPTSRWADDAAVCLAWQYIFISTPKSPFTEKAKRAYHRVVYEYPKGELEQWTYETLCKITTVRYLLNPPAEFFDLPPESYMKHYSTYQRLREYFLRGIILEHLKIADFQGAELEYEKMEKDTLINEDSLKYLKEMIVSWRERFKQRKWID